MKKIKNYQIDENSEVYAVSLVDEPAIESNFIYLNAQKPLTFKSDEKHMVYGCALRPDFPIYRRYDDEEFYVTFSKETIEKLSQKFLKNGFQKNWTTMHEDVVKNVYAVESWIKTDMKADKSIALGLDATLPVGSWFVGCKIENDDVWQKVKNGEFQGFSIEAFVELDEINFNKIQDKYMISEMFDEESLLSKIKAIINDALGNPKAEEEPEEVVNDAAVEVIEEVKDDPIEEEEKVDAEAEEPIAEPVVEEPKEEEVEQIVEDVVETVEENAVSEEDVKAEMQAVIDGLNEEINTLNQEVEELKKENKRLGSQPSASPVKMHSEKQNAWEIISQLREGRYFKK